DVVGDCIPVGDAVVIVVAHHLRGEQALQSGKPGQVRLHLAVAQHSDHGVRALHRRVEEQVQRVQEVGRVALAVEVDGDVLRVLGRAVARDASLPLLDVHSQTNRVLGSLVRGLDHIDDGAANATQGLRDGGNWAAAGGQLHDAGGCGNEASLQVDNVIDMGEAGARASL